MTSPPHPLTRSASQLKEVKGIVFDVQRMSMHDGPGMRTNVFLKGCPLRCGWCANPESQERQPQIVLHAANCIDCGQFAQTCTLCLSAHELSTRIELCPTGALHWVGEWRSAGAVMAEVRRDRPFYGEAGGLTLTGGEPTMQPDFCAALLQLAQQEGIHTAIETCGHTQWPVYARLLPLLDLVLFDVKHTAPEAHSRHTGFDNRLILDNLRRLAAAGANLRVRIPLIPDFNAQPETVAAIAELVRSLPGRVEGVDLLPYHTLGKAKYAALGRSYPWEGEARLSQEEVTACAAALRNSGLPFTVGG